MRIMILEDDRTLLGVWTEVLLAEGHQVTASTSISEAKKIISFKKFDMIISDLCLGDDISLPFLQVASYRNPSARIIIVTGTGWFGHGELAQLAPHVDLTLRKPFSNSDLLAYVDHLTDTRTEPGRNATINNIYQLHETA